MYMLNGWWFLSSGGSYPPVFTVGIEPIYKCTTPTIYSTPSVLCLVHEFFRN